MFSGVSLFQEQGVWNRAHLPAVRQDDLAEAVLRDAAPVPHLPLRRRQLERVAEQPLPVGRGPSKIGKIGNIFKFLAGSFSAASKRNFARKYAFDSIFQALQDLHSFAPLQSQNFRKKSV